MVVSFEPVEQVHRIRDVVSRVCALSIEDLELVLRETGKFEAFAPFVDATLYLDRREDNLMFQEVVRGLLEYRKLLVVHEHNYRR
jgi:hypothetical protein